MPLNSSIVGSGAEPHQSAVDARWTMAYAAGLGDTLPIYLNTRAPDGIVAHPLFPVCFEWDALGKLRNATNTGLRNDEVIRGVHATHDLLLARPIRPPEKLRTVLKVAGVVRTRAGAYQLSRADTLDAAGGPVCTSWYGTLYRGVEVEGPDRPAGDAPPHPKPSGNSPRLRAELPINVPAGFAHVYTECARIWNPIHTDSAVAARAGLPEIILHGTATLALAISRIVAHESDGDPTRVARIAGRFAGMVLMPSELRVRVLERLQGDRTATILFEVVNSRGEPAIRDGTIELKGSSK